MYLLKKISLPLTSYSSYQELEGYNIPEEMAKDMATMAALAQKNNCDNAGVTIFVNDNTTNSDTCSLMTAQNTMPRETTTWNGITFYHYQIYFTNMNTSWQTISSGSSVTSAILNTIKELAMFAVGTNETLGIASGLYQGGKSCYQSWVDATQSTPVYGNSSNKVQVNVTYNILNKYTYTWNSRNQEYDLGCSSQKARITQIDYDTFLYTSLGGSRDQNSVYPDRVYYSPNFLYPEQKAFDNKYVGWTEQVRGKIAQDGTDFTVYFTFPSFDWPSD